MATPVIWTQSDIDTLKASIAQGVSSVTYAGPPSRTVNYQNLAEMRSLLAEMVRQVNSANAPAYRRVSFSKGFDSG